jgi:hypothetical protein
MGQSEPKAEKPCICHIKKTGWPWKATGRVEGAKQEFRCRVCGRVHWAAV